MITKLFENGANVNNTGNTTGEQSFARNLQIIFFFFAARVYEQKFAQIMCASNTSMQSGRLIIRPWKII